VPEYWKRIWKPFKQPIKQWIVESEGFVFWHSNFKCSPTTLITPNVFDLSSYCIFSFFIPDMVKSNFFTRCIWSFPFSTRVVFKPFNPIGYIISFGICCVECIFIFYAEFSIGFTCYRRCIWSLVSNSYRIWI